MVILANRFHFHILEAIIKASIAPLLSLCGYLAIDIQIGNALFSIQKGR